MDSTARIDAPRSLPAALTGIDFQVASTWLLGFGLTVYLGLKGGGFDPLVSDKVGIVAWWIVLAGLLVGAFPRRRLGTLGWAGLGLMAIFLGWTALSLAWTDSSGNTSAEIARISTYLAVFALGLSIRGSRSVRLMVSAVGTAIAFLALIALLSRLHPAWFPDATETARFLGGSRNRLSFPLNYWNAVAILTAMGLPLLLNVATTAKSTLLRSFAAAALPAMVLTIYFTISRGGVIAGVIAVGIYLACAGDRVPRLTTTAVAAVGGAVLVAGAAQRDALQEGLQTAAAHHQGNEMLWMTIVVCLGVGLVQAAISTVLLNEMRPAWSVPSRRFIVAASAAAVLVLLIAGAAVNAPHRLSHAVDQFKSGENAGRSASRLTSAAGDNRYQLWGAAVDEFKGDPVHGTGSGSFEYWWTRKGGEDTVDHDAHSLYLQTMGELGIVGILTLGAFLALVLFAGGRVIQRAGRSARPQASAALGAIGAFVVAAAFDWIWQVPVLPVTMLLLAGVLITAGVRSPSRSRSGPTLGAPVRVGLAIFALAALVAIAIPLSAGNLIRESQSEAQAANLPAALSAARSAQNVEPDAALPHLQEALVLERQGEYGAAVEQARLATAKESVNWRNWLVLSRVQAEAGDAKAALRSYKKARSLNPTSRLFVQ
jgi:hypothetical protein